MKRILITGKTSWIGNELERRLHVNDEYEVTRVSLRDAAWKNDSWEKYDSIVHAAADLSTDLEKGRTVQTDETRQRRTIPTTWPPKRKRTALAT